MTDLKKALDAVPANPNPLENGVVDPTPGKGQGGWWRAIVSALKYVVGKS